MGKITPLQLQVKVLICLHHTRHKKPKTNLIQHSNINALYQFLPVFFQITPCIDPLHNWHYGLSLNRYQHPDKLAITESDNWALTF